MQQDTGRIDVQDFAFRGLRRFRIFPSGDLESSGFDGCTHYRLLTISNAYGLIFAAWPNSGLKVVPTSEIHRFLNESTKERDNEITDFKNDMVEFYNSPAASPIVRLQCNCDGTILAICYDKPTPMADLYDVRALAPEYRGPKPVPLFWRVRLDDVESSSVCDFQWNPTAPDLFCSVCSSGTATVISVNLNQPSTFTIQGTIKRTPDMTATCASWSPKGKQLAIGFENGTVCQYKPQNLQLAKKWTPPSPAIALLLTRLVDICWVSTSQFFLVTTGGKPDGDQLLLIHLTLPKESGGAAGNLTYINYDDVCYGSANDRKSMPVRYLIQHVQEWALALCSSTISMETAVLGWKTEAKRWHVWDLDDNSRCQLPLTQNNDECFPVGIDIDRTSETPVVLTSPDGEQIKTLPPAPILLILSTDGALCPFRMVHSSSDAALCRPAMKVQNSSEIKVGVSSVSADVQRAVDSTNEISTSVTLPLPRQAMENQQRSATGQILGKNANVKQQPIAPSFESRPPQHREIPKISEEANDERTMRENNRLLRMEVIKWAVDFEKELTGLKSKLARPLDTPASKEQLVQKTKELYDLSNGIDDLMIDLAEKRSKADHLRTSICGYLVRADQARLLAERRSSEEFQTLLRYRPLTAKQEHEMTALRHRVKEAQTAIDDLTSQVENLHLSKQAFQTSPSVKSKMHKKNSLELIYRTLANMQAIIIQQKSRAESVRKDIAEIRMLKRQSFDRARHTTNDTDQLSRSLLHASLRDDSMDSSSPHTSVINYGLVQNKTPYKMTSTLKHLIGKREATPRKTTVPVLKPPMFTFMKKQDSATTSSKPALIREQRQAKETKTQHTTLSEKGTTSQATKQEQQQLAKNVQKKVPSQIVASLVPTTMTTFATSTPINTVVKIPFIGQQQKMAFPAPVPTTVETKIPPIAKPSKAPSAVAVAPTSGSVQGMPLFGSLSVTREKATAVETKPTVPTVAPSFKTPAGTGLSASAAASFGSVGITPSLASMIQQKPSAPLNVVETKPPVASALHPTSKSPVAVDLSKPTVTSAPASFEGSPSVGSASIFQQMPSPVSTIVETKLAAPAIAQTSTTPIAASSSIPASVTPGGSGVIPSFGSASIFQQKSLPSTPPETIPAAPAIAPTSKSPATVDSSAPTTTMAAPATGTPLFGSSPTPMPISVESKPAAAIAPVSTAQGPMIASGDFAGALSFGSLSMSEPKPVSVSTSTATQPTPTTTASLGAFGGTLLFGSTPTLQQKFSAVSTSVETVPTAPATTPAPKIPSAFGSPLSSSTTPSGGLGSTGLFGSASLFQQQPSSTSATMEAEMVPITTPANKAPSAAPFSFGAFNSSGGGTPNSAGQSFGNFGTAQTGGAFGAKPAFGSSNVFGGSAVFGGGGGSPSGGSIFGGSPSFGSSANTGSAFGALGSGSAFAAFARTPMPTFGALASNVAPNAVAPPAPATATPSGGFGGGPSFGSFGSTSIFQQQPQQAAFFGGQQQPTQQSQPQQSSFSQWR